MAIKNMRFLGLSIETIREVLADPSVAFYYFIKQEKSLQQELKELKWKAESISSIIDDLNTGTDFDVLSNSLSTHVKHNPDNNDVKPVDMNDAELLAYFFWGRYVGKTSLTEYQKFLWEKLKKTIVITQNESTCRLRDSLFLFQNNHVKREFYDYCDEKISSEISSLKDDDIKKFTERMLHRAQQHLSNPSWVHDWKQNEKYLVDTGYFFDSEASVIMCEMSPFFKCYKRNINRCGSLLEGYKKSVQGQEFLNSIYSTLSKDIDLYSHNHATLIGICLWN